MTRTAVNGSPASAIVGGVDVRIGHARRRRAQRPEPMVAVRSVGHGSVISDWFTRDCRV